MLQAHSMKLADAATHRGHGDPSISMPPSKTPPGPRRLTLVCDSRWEQFGLAEHSPPGHRCLAHPHPHPHPHSFASQTRVASYHTIRIHPSPHAPSPPFTRPTSPHLVYPIESSTLHAHYSRAAHQTQGPYSKKQFECGFLLPIRAASRLQNARFRS